MSNTTESKDFTIKTDEGVAINTELDAQTLLLQYIRTATELNKEIVTQLKINNKHLSIITGDELTSKDIDN